MFSRFKVVKVIAKGSPAIANHVHFTFNRKNNAVPLRTPPLCSLRRKWYPLFARSENEERTTFRGTRDAPRPPCRLPYFFPLFLDFCAQRAVNANRKPNWNLPGAEGARTINSRDTLKYEQESTWNVFDERVDDRSIYISRDLSATFGPTLFSARITPALVK